MCRRGRGGLRGSFWTRLINPLYELSEYGRVTMLRNQEKNKDNWHHRIHTETKVEKGRTYSKNEGQQVDQTLHRVATKEREEINGTTKKMARRHSKEGGNHLGQESNRHKTMEDIYWGLHPAVDGQNLGERQKANEVSARSCADRLELCYEGAFEQA